MGKLVAGIIAGAIAGIIGAAAWAIIAYAASLEIGWLAWLIGGAVGWSVSIAGEKGPRAGLIAGVIAVISICGGKIAAAHFAMGKYIEKELGSHITEESYNKIKEDAKIFAKLTSPDEYPAFMVEREYTEAAKPEEVTQEERDRFAESQAKYLRDFQADPPTFDEWKAQRLAIARMLMAMQVTLWDMLKMTLGLFDIVFFLLGVGTAYRVAARAA